jgi:hypothetical protein
MELNPVLVTPTGCYILGAWVQVHPAEERQEWQPRQM